MWCRLLQYKFQSKGDYKYYKWTVRLNVITTSEKNMVQI